MKESSECLLWKGDNKETEARQSVGGRNGDQYTMTVKKKKRQAEKQTEVEKHERVTEGEKEQKMDTV